YCKGCYRSRDERFYWNKFTNAEKRKVISLCQQRYKRFLQKKQQAEQQQTNPEQGGFDF
ncbi:Fe-S oxidoreductase, partial [Pseudoalteromonas shioyasakiensis]